MTEAEYQATRAVTPLLAALAARVAVLEQKVAVLEATATTAWTTTVTGDPGGYGTQWSEAAATAG